MEQIRRVSFYFRISLQLLMVLMPLFCVMAWTHSPESLVMLGGIINMCFIPSGYVHHLLHTLSATDRLLGFMVSCLPLVIVLYMLYALVRLFQLYERGEIFSLQNVHYIRKAGYALLLTQLINPLYEALMGIVLTWHNPHGHRFFSVTLDQTNVCILFMALLIILVSWIMAEGCKLKEEQKLTI